MRDSRLTNYATGAAICENLASKGCNLIMNYTSPGSQSKANELATSLTKSHNIKAYTTRADLSTPTGPASLVASAKSHFGADCTIHILINNAGIAGNAHLHNSTPEQLTSDFQAQYATNVLAPLLLMQAVLPHLPRDRSGRIVNLSSVSASLGFAGQSVYGGTKAALEAMTRTWARELQFRATVNAVNPGPVATDMYGKTEPWFQAQMRPWNANAPGMQVSGELDGMEAVQDVQSGGADGSGTGGRAGTPEQVAGVVGMLCSVESQWCNGSVVCCNGGLRMSG